MVNKTLNIFDSFTVCQPNDLENIEVFVFKYFFIWLYFKHLRNPTLSILL